MQKVHIHPTFQAQKEAILTCIQNFESQGEYVTKGERNVIKSFPLGENTINVKSFRVPKAFNSFVYRYFRLSKARRSFEYAEKLLMRAIKTPFPVAYVENYRGLGLKESYYVSLHIDYDFDFRALIHDPLFENRTVILEQFAEFCFQLHENNINFLDHSPGNTLIVKRNNTKYDFYLIDLNRMKFESMNLVQRMENLKRLWLSKQMIHIISKRYAELVNKELYEVQDLLLKYSQAFKRKINRKKYLKKKYLKRR
ncbi:lipopolysaccharide kinase InaA family protein [Kordia zhangzhouensis]|uniref:lipopolysaccharide kinase InaA family protein n=1 Tax=Kordia zhangzhouensis TaxID=1620405 RepID=UPI000629B02A|nr:lipopolysaccharide kinase InaA family protein [Kordia zhangzhouensis]